MSCDKFNCIIAISSTVVKKVRSNTNICVIGCHNWCFNIGLTCLLLIRPSVTSKSKQQPRDRRKLREKRRSCGVVHVPSTESTGGSSGDPEADGSPSVSPECRCPPLSGQQGSCASSPPHHPHLTDSARSRRTLHVKPRNKSPSDLEADDEDNEDYDSLNMSGSTISLAQPSSGLVGATPPSAHHHRPMPHSASRTELQRPCGGQRSSALSAQESAAELQFARQENRRLLQLLAEREQRIAELERRLVAVTAHTCPPVPHPLDSKTSTAAIAAALESLTTD
ncbi:hypothetical protein FHG87_009145 [Trinorchestia longiramus]|nr:hypothetical protein FHG87_009145 [Trinorchestia longiramus]